jgi:diacylglycerol kinase family enzyme
MICVIFNPTAARQRARARIEALRQTLGSGAEFRPTERPGHGEELAFAAAQEGFDIVVAAGGDGTVHEVANGLLRADKPNTLFAVVPIGSANDYAYSLDLASGARQSPGDTPHRGTDVPRSPKDILSVDVGLVRDERGRERYFVNTLGLGFSGAVAIESRKIRWLQGIALYGLAFLRAIMFRYTCPMMECKFDDTERRTPTLSMTIAIAHREGSFIVAPNARLDDGLFDYIHAGPLSRWEVLRTMPKLASGGALPTHPHLWTGVCREVHLRSEAPLTVHLDGEFFSKPEDNVRELTVRILPGRLKVKTGFAQGK